MTLREQINEDLKDAMRARAVERVGVFRLIFSEIKQKEVDSRQMLTDVEILAVLEKMIKQRKDSIQQFEKAQRQDLVDKEKAELELIQSYLPTPFSESEILTMIHVAVAEVQKEKPQTVGAGMMGLIIQKIRAPLAGRADMSIVSGLVKKVLSQGA